MKEVQPEVDPSYQADFLWLLFEWDNNPDDLWDFMYYTSDRIRVLFSPRGHDSFLESDEHNNEECFFKTRQVALANLKSELSSLVSDKHAQAILKLEPILKKNVINPSIEKCLWIQLIWNEDVAESWFSINKIALSTRIWFVEKWKVLAVDKKPDRVADIETKAPILVTEPFVARLSDITNSISRILINKSEQQGAVRNFLSNLRKSLKDSGYPVLSSFTIWFKYFEDWTLVIDFLWWKNVSFDPYNLEKLLNLALVPAIRSTLGLKWVSWNVSIIPNWESYKLSLPIKFWKRERSKTVIKNTSEFPESISHTAWEDIRSIITGRLSQDDESRLSQAVLQDWDIDAENKLIDHWYVILVECVKRCDLNNNNDYDHLIRVWYDWLSYAAKTYDSSTWRFFSYVRICVMEYINRSMFSFYRKLSDTKLSPEQEIDLSKKVLEWNIDAKNRLIESWYIYIKSVATWFKSCSFEYDDIFQAWYEWLDHAAGSYDYKKWEFKDYACVCINYYMIWALIKEWHLIKSSELSELFPSLDSFVNDVSTLMWRDLNYKSLFYKMLGFKKKLLFAIGRYSHSLDSIEDLIPGTNHAWVWLKLWYMIPDSKWLEAFYKRFWNLDAEHFINNSKLSDEEKTVVSMIFWIWTDRVYSIEEIWNTLKIENVSTILFSAINKIRKSNWIESKWEIWFWKISNPLEIIPNYKHIHHHWDKSKLFVSYLNSWIAYLVKKEFWLDSYSILYSTFIRFRKFKCIIFSSKFYFKLWIYW